jgi:hypothetical protein
VQEAEPGCVSISDSTYALLTDVDGFKPCPPIDTDLGVIRIWSRPVVERVAVEAAAPPETKTVPFPAK